MYRTRISDAVDFNFYRVAIDYVDNGRDHFRRRRCGVGGSARVLTSARSREPRRRTDRRNPPSDLTDMGSHRAQASAAEAEIPREARDDVCRSVKILSLRLAIYRVVVQRSLAARGGFHRDTS